MVSIGFNSVGSFDGTVGGPDVLNNPTSIQFGPDGRLYVAEQNGDINAFTVTIENGEYVAAAHEELLLPGGGGVVKSIQNHNDDGSLSGNGNRQVTGLVVEGTAENPVLYISSSDPRIAQNGEVGLDTNSGVVTRVTWTGSEWEAVDIIRGLPRSEENHSVNGLQLSPDGNTLYLAVGGNTNNGAPSQFFSYTAEYALSGTIIEIDLVDINSRSVLTDNAPGQNGRQYVYDLPTLDDPTIPNVTDGVGEDEFGLDEAGPWGGNDGFNQAILPADAPFRIFADGLRNHYDLALTESGQLYTVDNGSNVNLGGNPLDANGIPTDQPGAGEATNAPNDPGPGDPEPLFLVTDGGYYGHPVPVRANQDLEWIIYDDDGNPDTSVTPNSFPNVSDLVPGSVNIQNGFVIDPSKFTGDPTRLTQSGIRVERDSPESNAITTVGSSSNGLVEYTANAFDGALQGALVVTQFNGNVTLLNLNAAGTALEPLIDPGTDGILGTADDEVIDEDGIFPLITGQGQPLDVTVGPDGTLWVAEFGPDNINVFAPADLILPGDNDFDDDGIINANDPFIRDNTNGGSVLVLPDQTLLWDFDADQDNNLPGPDGYATGLTGVMIDGVTDFEAFFQQPSSQPGQIINLDNVKFATAAGGGTTVIEFVSDGDPFADGNTGEYLFHTGVTIDPTVDTFNIKWSLFNPAAEFTGPFQQIGGYIGTGDQSNYLKIVAIQSDSGEIQILLEDNDVVLTESFIQADDLFTVPPNQKIFFELEVDPSAATATPTVTYETGGGNTTTVSGTALNLSGTAVLDAILGNYTVNGQTSGLAVGLFSSNSGQSAADTFQAVFDDIEITASGLPAIPELTIDDVGQNEADGTTTFTVTLSQPAAGDVTVDFSTVDGTAIAGEDYVAISGTLTFPAGTTTQTVTVDLIDDTLAEANETFFVDLSNPVGATVASGAGTATILDDDSNILYRINVGGEAVTALDGLLDWSEDTSANPSPFRIGNGGNNVFTSGATIDFSDPSLPEAAQIETLFQSERFDPGAAPTMQWELPVDPGTEVEVRLYFAELFSGITGAGQRVFDVALEGTVPTAFDDIDPFGATGQLNTASVFSATTTVTDGSVSLEFLNNIQNPALKAVEILAVDTSGLPPDLSIDDVTVNEDDGTATFTVSLSEASNTEVTVDFATADGTAVAGSDYTSTSGTLTFAAGETTQTLTVDILNDADVEVDDETFTVSLSNANGAAIADLTGIGTIVDDDAALLPELSIDDITVNETDGTATFTVNLSAAAASDATVNFATADGTATAGSDYVTASGTLTFDAGVTSQTVTVDLIDDDVAEGSETFAVNLTGAVGATISDGSGAATILDNDSDILYRVNVGGSEVAAPDGLLVWSEDTNVNPSPFRVGNGGNNIFTANNANIDLSDPNLPAGALVNTIFQSERFDPGFAPTMQWEFAVDPGTEVEVRLYFAELFNGITDAGQRVFDVALEGAVPTAFDDIDPFGVTGQLNTASVFSATTTVTDGSVSLEFLNNIENPALKAVEIVQVDTSGLPPELSIDDVTVNEDAGTATFTVSLSQPSDADVTVDFTTADGTAVAGNDYTSTSGTLTFAAGETTQTLTVDILNDADVEANDETFTVNLSNANGAAIADATGIGTIVDDDAALLPELSIDDITVNEADGTATFTVNLSAAAASDVTVNFATADGTAIAGSDYAAANGTLTFAAGTTSQTVTVDLIDDAVAEGSETFAVNLTGATGATIVDGSGTATISDNDSDILYRVNVGGSEVAAPDGLLAWSEDTSANPSPFRIGNGGNNIFTANNANINLSDPNLPAGALVDTIFQSERFDPGFAPTMQWEFAVDPGTEVEVRLYFAELFNGITDAGQRVFDVALEGAVPTAFDDIDPFGVTGQLNTASVFSTTATITDGSVSLEFLNNIENPALKAVEILQIDTSGLPPELSIGDVTVNEDAGTATFAVSLSEASDTDITVDFATVDGTAVAGSDYTGGTGTLTFAAGATSQTIAVAITDDAEVEADETFTVELANASGAVITDGSATGTILDNDVAPSEGLLFNLSTNDTVGGVAVTPQDIVQFDGTNFDLFFDGSDVFVTTGGDDDDDDDTSSIAIDAFDVISDSEILISFSSPVTLLDSGAIAVTSGGDDDDDDDSGVTIDDSDIVKFTAASLGENTAGSFSLHFDGSDVGLSTNGEDIDGLASLPDGSLLISTVGNFNASGNSGNDEDILQFTPTSLGSNTAGSLSFFVDGSDIGLGSEDVDAFGVDAIGDLFFSTTNNFSVSGVSGADEDVFGFTPSSTGTATSGNFASELFFDGSQFGLASEDIKGIDLTFGDTSNSTPAGPPIRIEAGEADTIVNFRPETIDAASGGQVLSLAGGSGDEVGSATYGFNEAPGTYNITVGTFDENDGLARFTVELNDAETGTTTEIGTLELDANLGSNLPNAQTAISPIVASGIALTPGDSLTVTGFEDGFEFARLDYIELTPVNV
ncbi:MAG: Calx-beta domain-containing protein [Leptolyngbyaceae cyanobacterium]